MSLMKKLFPAQMPLSVTETLYCALAAGLTIALNAWLSPQLLPGDYHVYLAASMGASTILAMVLYHSPLSQPWAIIGGHLVSASAGLVATTLIADPVPACLLAMVLTVTLQVALRCLHAPGGGTALLPILSGAALHAEGLGFLGVVLINTLVLVGAALLFNNLLPGRRYPLAFIPPPLHPPEPVFREQDLRAAMLAMHGAIDIAPEDLERVYELALAHLRGETINT